MRFPHQWSADSIDKPSLLQSPGMRPKCHTISFYSACTTFDASPMVPGQSGALVKNMVPFGMQTVQGKSPSSLFPIIWPLCLVLIPERMWHLLMGSKVKEMGIPAESRYNLLPLRDRCTVWKRTTRGAQRRFPPLPLSRVGGMLAEISVIVNHWCISNGVRNSTDRFVEKGGYCVDGGEMIWLRRGLTLGNS